ncbi:hypothetical protein ANN_08814 [Periplaneta americana]|uniref:UDENN domain-containing protein n=1 Tax=Periplaneta americana TaxID=6978 RepID=A0ABQ8T2I7_PERAM|nr:hypothetical protein ANN_08814 [Periplaneta americana]
MSIANWKSRCEEKRNLTQKLLPKKPARVLRNTLEQLSQKLSQFRKSYAQNSARDASIDRDFQQKRKEQCLELEIQEAFLRFMATVLKGYRGYLLPITKAPTIGTTDPNSLFDLQGFLRSRDKTHNKFFTLVMKTQMFIRFIEERSFVSDMDASLAFFDECTEKVDSDDGDGRLLELDESHQSERTVFIMPPEPTGLPLGRMYFYKSFVLDPLLFSRKELKFHNTGSRLSGAVPGSPMARRTKHEVKSAQKLARKHALSPELWAKCLLTTCYSRTAGYTLLDRKRNEEILEQLEVESVEEKINRYKLNWLDHVRKMENSRSPKIMMQYKPRGRRRPGRPLRRLLDGAETGLQRPTHSLKFTVRRTQAFQIQFTALRTQDFQIRRTRLDTATVTDSLKFTAHRTRSSGYGPQHVELQSLQSLSPSRRNLGLKLDRISKEAGLSMNPEKTKLMSNASEDPIHLNGQPLEYVEDYTYLGQNLSFSSNSEKEIKRRISMAWKKFWSLKFILTNKFQKLSLKIETLEKCVLPVLLYGCQTWSLTSKQKHMLQTCQRSMERKILQLSLRNKVRNEELRNCTGMKDVLNTAENLKWKWGGHVVRMDHRQWTHRLILWDPRIGRRRVGRQTTRWADFFKKKAGSQWTSSTRDRQLWRNLEATVLSV